MTDNVKRKRALKRYWADDRKSARHRLKLREGMKRFWEDRGVQ